MEEIKCSTRDGILRAAKSEFMKQGYQRAGLRQIAGAAHVTTGALYGYFANKKELLDALVGTEYRHIIDLYRKTLEEFEALPAAEQQRIMASYTEKRAMEMMNYIYDHFDAFKLMLCCCEGTEYAHLVHEIAELEVEATHRFISVTEHAGMTLRPVNPMLEHMLTSGMFSTFFELIVHDVDRGEAKEYLTQLLTFYQAGWASIMGF